MIVKTKGTSLLYFTRCCQAVFCNLYVGSVNIICTVLNFVADTGGVLNHLNCLLVRLGKTLCGYYYFDDLLG